MKIKYEFSNKEIEEEFNNLRRQARFVGITTIIMAIAALGVSLANFANPTAVGLIFVIITAGGFYKMQKPIARINEIIQSNDCRFVEVP